MTSGRSTLRWATRPSSTPTSLLGLHRTVHSTGMTSSSSSSPTSLSEATQRSPLCPLSPVMILLESPSHHPGPPLAAGLRLLLAGAAPPRCELRPWRSLTFRVCAQASCSQPGGYHVAAILAAMQLLVPPCFAFPPYPPAWGPRRGISSCLMQSPSQCAGGANDSSAPVSLSVLTLQIKLLLLVYIVARLVRESWKLSKVSRNYYQ